MIGNKSGRDEATSTLRPAAAEPVVYHAQRFALELKHPTHHRAPLVRQAQAVPQPREQPVLQLRFRS